MDNSESQTNPAPSVPALSISTITSTLKDVGNAIMPVKSTNGYNDFHTNHLINAALCFHNQLCKLMNKLISHGFLPYIMLLGKVRPSVKISAGNKSSSNN